MSLRKDFPKETKHCHFVVSLSSIQVFAPRDCPRFCKRNWKFVWQWKNKTNWKYIHSHRLTYDAIYLMWNLQMSPKKSRSYFPRCENCIGLYLTPTRPGKLVTAEFEIQFKYFIKDLFVLDGRKSYTVISLDVLLVLLRLDAVSQRTLFFFQEKRVSTLLDEFGKLIVEIQLRFCGEMAVL